MFARKGERFARWKTPKGKTKTAFVVIPTEGKFAGQERIVVETPTYFADYRDGNGHLRRVATGCRDETAARAVLGELERRAELVKAGVMTSTEDAIADHQVIPLAQHLDAYETTLRANGVGDSYRVGTLQDSRP